MANAFEELAGQPLSFYSADGKRKRIIGKITSVQVAEDGEALLVQASIDDESIQRLAKGDHASIKPQVPG